MLDTLCRHGLRVRDLPRGESYLVAMKFAPARSSLSRKLYDAARVAGGRGGFGISGGGGSGGAGGRGGGGLGGAGGGGGGGGGAAGITTTLINFREQDATSVPPTVVVVEVTKKTLQTYADGGITRSDVGDRAIITRY